MSNKGIQVEKNKEQLTITYEWYNLSFYLYFFGGIFFTMLTSTVTLGIIMGLCSLLYAARIFFNKTIINITDKYLEIEHKPFPFLFSINKVATRNIRQLYVVEVFDWERNPKGFELRAILFKGRNVTLLKDIDIDGHQLQIIEAQIEEYIGITDYPVHGQYLKPNKTIEYVNEIRKNIKPKASQQARKSILSFSTLNAVYKSELEEVISMADQKMQIVHITQLDWDDGNSDKLFQLYGADGTERLLYLVQNRAILTAFEERKLNLSETSHLNFSAVAPPQNISLDGIDYTINHHKKGKYYISELREPLKVQQWIYFNEIQEKYIRVNVFEKEGSVSFQIGEKIKISNFFDAEKTLDLDENPINNKLELKDKIIVKRNRKS